LAADIETARMWIADNDWIPIIGALKHSPKFDVLVRLDAVGFLRRSSTRNVTLDQGKIYGMAFHKHAIILSSSVERRVQLPAALLTVQGKEVLKIVAPSEDLDVIRQFANEMKSMGPEKVQIGEIVVTLAPGRVELENVQEV
jgi:hypothetical protein